MFEIKPSDEEQQRVLHSEFDINTHKKTFIDYLEVVIDEFGNVMYAVPSHTEKLAEIYTGRNAVTRKAMITNMLTDHSGLDMAEWLCKKTHCVCVWNDSYKGEPNQKQLNTLKTLKLSGIYHGPVYNTYERQREELRKIMHELKEFTQNFDTKGD